jgi:hypothetical protein
MTRILRKGLWGALTLALLCCLPPATAEAAGRQDRESRVVRRGDVDRYRQRYRADRYRPDRYRYYEGPARGSRYYPYEYRRYRYPYGTYYGIPGYGYYRGPWGRGGVIAGPFRFWW